ncbi:MAG: outer membrane protein assembly factor BamD [Fibrobacteria bacterium]|nr:outer membrane protein assembly factor BamD [Fibrobacteria bacterium]
MKTVCALRPLWAFFLLLVLSCSSKDDFSHEESCNKKFEKLHEKFVKEKYSSIKISLSDLLSTCSGAAFIEQAQFELAESHYNLKEWMEAQAEYSNLLRDFPSSQFAEQASFRLSECAAEQIYSVNRDQSKTHEAIRSYENFIMEYANSKLVDSAKANANKLRAQLAEKEMNVATLYMKLDEYLSAAVYLKSVLKSYKDVVDAKALYLKLARCYIHLKQFDEADAYLKELENIKKSDPYFKKVKKLVVLKEKKQAEHAKRLKKKTSKANQVEEL